MRLNASPSRFPTRFSSVRDETLELGHLCAVVSQSKADCPMRAPGVLFATALSVLMVTAPETRAERLISAHPLAPVAFTFPAVRDNTKIAEVRLSHRNVKRSRYSRSPGVY